MHGWLVSSIETLEDEVRTLALVRSGVARAAEGVLRRCIDELHALASDLDAQSPGSQPCLTDGPVQESSDVPSVLPPVSSIVSTSPSATPSVGHGGQEADVSDFAGEDGDGGDGDVSIALSATVVASVPLSDASIDLVVDELTPTLDLFGTRLHQFATVKSDDPFRLSLAWVVEQPTELVGATMFAGGWSARFELPFGVVVDVTVEADGSQLPDMPSAVEALELWCAAEDEAAAEDDVVRVPPTVMRLAVSRQDAQPIEGQVLDAARRAALDALARLCGDVRFVLDGGYESPSEWVESVEFAATASRSHRLAIVEGAGAFDGVQRIAGVMVRARLLA